MTERPDSLVRVLDLVMWMLPVVAAVHPANELRERVRAGKPDGQSR